MHIITELDIDSGALFARNPYNTEFEIGLHFLMLTISARTFTTDRTEFIGRNGTLKNPDAMNRIKTFRKNRAALDPCAAIQVAFDLDAEEGKGNYFPPGCRKKL